MDPDSGAGLLHRLTSYSPARSWDVRADDPRLRQDRVPSDPATRPPQFKVYRPGLPVLRLPRQLPSTGGPAAGVLAGACLPAQPLDATQLGRLLFLGAGVVRTTSVSWGVMRFRAAGSAGGRFPLELYVASRGVAGVPDAVHWYDAEQHALVQIGPAAAGQATTTTLIVTGVPWRTGWKYAERGWRHLYWDAGTVLAQLQAVAASAGLAARVWPVFPDAAVSRLTGADGVHEYPLALVTLGAGTPAVVPGGPAVPGELPPVELPLCTAAQRELQRICLGQTLGGDAAYVVMAAVPAEVLDDRGYRHAQLAAGLVEGRLHLAAYTLGAGATGMTFLDSEIPGLLGEPDGLVTLLFTCVGAPVYATCSGGGPGAPAEFRMVTRPGG